MNILEAIEEMKKGKWLSLPDGLPHTMVPLPDSTYALFYKYNNSLHHISVINVKELLSNEWEVVPPLSEGEKQ